MWLTIWKWILLSGFDLVSPLARRSARGPGKSSASQEMGAPNFQQENPWKNPWKPMEKPMETHGKTHGNPWKKPWKNGQTNGKTPWNVFPCFLKCWVTHWQRYITQWQKHSWKHVLFWGNKYGIYGRNLMKHGNGCHLQTVAFLKPAKYTTGWWF